MSYDYPGLVGLADPGASPNWVLNCPAWCDGQHEVDDQSAAYHGRVVAHRGNTCVALSCISYHDQTETGSTVIILDADAIAAPTELEESAAIRLVGVLEAAAGGTSWLGNALRSALDLLDPGAGWTGPLSRAGGLAQSPAEQGA